MHPRWFRKPTLNDEIYLIPQNREIKGVTEWHPAVLKVDTRPTLSLAVCTASQGLLLLGPFNRPASLISAMIIDLDGARSRWLLTLGKAHLAGVQPA
jgi:hypothetical protein